MRVRQHQLVYATLGKLMGNEIHALQLNTYTPKQWAELLKELG
jgi:acid stress-induced BolA-like protein IbaG/YrbA